MTLSTHVLDTVHGRPATGLRVQWDVLRDGEWAAAGHGVTDDDGRIAEWTTSSTETGVHRLVFATGEWLTGEGHDAFWPEVVVLFEVSEPDEHHHVPLLLSPYAYSTYRGS